MKTQFSNSWKASSQQRKQRKYRYNAPLHTLQKFVSCHLSPALRKKYGMRNLKLRKGDSIKIMRGQYKGKTGKVERVDIKKTRVYVTGVEVTLKKGTKSMIPLEPSNLMIMEFDQSDMKRKKIIERNLKKES